MECNAEISVMEEQILEHGDLHWPSFVITLEVGERLRPSSSSSLRVLVASDNGR